MNRPMFTGILLIMCLTLAACAPAETATSVPTSMATEPPLATAAETETPSTGTGGETSTAPSVGTPAAGTTDTPGVPVTGADCDTVTVQVSTNATGGTGGTGTTGTSTPGATTTGTPSTGTGTTTTVTEPFLVDCNGMSLYIFMEDVQNSGSSACTDTECMTEWPPLTIESGEPMAGDDVDETMLGTITRDDGTTQVTYNGWPLYFFDGDLDPGDTNGQGMEDLWFLISPDGNPIQ